MTTQIRQLALGDFDLFGDGDTWRCETLADGTDLSGNPQPVEVAIQTLIQDGSVSYTEKYDNATISIRVSIIGPDAEALDEGAAALFAELGKPNVLTYEGPLAFGPVAWDVVNSRLERNSDDLAEVRGERYYTVTLTALPFRRATEETVIPALATSGTTTTLVDDGASTTGWTGSVDGTATAPSVSSGAVGLTTAAIDGGHTVALQRAGTINTSSTKYLMIDWRGVAGYPLRAFADGVELNRVSQANSPTAGTLRTWFVVQASSVGQLVLQQSTAPFIGPYSRTLYIDSISRTDVRPSLGSARQLQRVIEVPGTARTPGRLAIEHETSTLGYVIAFTWTGGAEGQSPPLRQYRVSGGTVTTDASMVSGAKEPIKSTTITYEIPVSALARDRYLLMLKLLTTDVASGPTTSLTWTSQVLLNGNALGPAETGTVSVSERSIDGPARVAYAPIGSLQLPSRDVNENSGAVQRITLTATTTLTDLLLDEGWLFPSSGQLNVAYCGGSGTPVLGGSSNRMWIEPASLATPRPTIKVGTRSDRQDGHFPFDPPMSWQQPHFQGATNVLTVTPGATDANVTLAFYERKAG